MVKKPGRGRAWITRSRRVIRDYERLTARHETIVSWAMIITMSTARLKQTSLLLPGLT